MITDQFNISEILKKRIMEYENESRAEQVGKVVESGDGIARIKGLPHAMAGEMIEFSPGVFGLVLNLEPDEIVAVVLAPHTSVKEGDPARCTRQVMQVPVGEALIGRVVNGIGVPVDGLGEIKTDKYRPVEGPAPAVLDRMPVTEPMHTGIKLIDALIPIGKGQRELVIGDRATGKSVILIDAILNQKGQNVICIYVAIGQKSSNIVQMVEKLKEHGAMEYTTVVTASASDPASLQYLAPFSGCAMAEEFMYAGKDVLIIYDDLTKHAQAYRMISILLRRPPGREAYPGDVFYLHSRLLERSAKLSAKLGGGSMTALPVVETQLGDVSAYIPTNVISITDGQIFLGTEIFNSGIRPAVNVGISVSRVGGSAQTKAMRKISGNLRLDLAQYREKAQFALFSEDIDKETKAQLIRGKAITEILKQEKNKPMPIEMQIVVLFAAVNGFFDKVEPPKLGLYEKELLGYMSRTFTNILEEIRTSKEISQKTDVALRSALASFQEVCSV